MDTIRARGVEVAFERRGEGPPLVLVHGASEDGRTWRPQLTSLADEFTVPTPAGLFAGEPPVELIPLLREMAAAVRRETLRTQLRLMAETDQRNLLPRIVVPSLLLWGALDARSPLRVAHAFEEAIPDATLVVIPDCGHASNLEQPAAFNRAVREFCRTHALPSDRDERSEPE